jgi:RNA polymerase sigma-70 factor (ECF subfamily)
METARSARGGRRQNLSLRQLAPLRNRHESQTVDSEFDRFYRRHVAEVYQYALAVLANPADAEDVTQQTFLNAYRAFQRGDQPHKAHNWLIKIAHNVCRMRWRQSSRRPQEVPLEHAQEPVTLDEDRPSLDAVLKALARLPFNQRAAIVMREVEDRSYAEIADVLGTTVPAVEALLFRARTHLRARRKTLGVVTLVPVPSSLSSYFSSGGGGALAAGGTVLGSELAIKVAGMVVAGVVAGGLGFSAVNVVATSDAAQPVVEPHRYQQPLWANAVSRLAPSRPGAAGRALDVRASKQPSRRSVHGGRFEKEPVGDVPSQADLSAPAPAQAAAAPSLDASAPASSVSNLVGSLTSPSSSPAPAPAPAPAPVAVPPPPALPPAPALPPPPALPPAPALPVTIDVPTVQVPSIPPIIK